MEQKLHEIASEEHALKSELEKNLKYQEYLESVASSHTKFFPELSDILKRYNVLHSCNADLNEKSISGEQVLHIAVAYIYIVCYAIIILCFILCSSSVE